MVKKHFFFILWGTINSMHSKRISDTYEDLLHNRWVKLKNLKFAGFKDSDGNLKYPLLSDRLYKHFMEKLYSTKTWSLRNWPHSTKTLPKNWDFKAESTLSPGVKNYFIAMLYGTVHSTCNAMIIDISASPLLNWWNNLKTLAFVRLKAQFALDVWRTSRAPSWDMRKSWQYHSRNWVKVFQVLTEIWALIIKYHVKKPF
jgi:hypothetical protein